MQNFKLSLIILFLVNYIFSQSFTKITQGDFVNDSGQSFGVAWADLNNDGFADLFISNGGAAAINENNFLYINNGDGTFSKLSQGDIINGNQRSIGASIADYNNDGLEDIAVANRDNQNNFLYLNSGDFKFIKIEDSLIVSEGGNSNANSWIDYNNNGKIDLYVTNFFSPAFLYDNLNGTSFNKISGVHPVIESNTSISGAWSDFDNDGDADLFVANAASAGKENLLYLNLGNGVFEKITNSDIVKDKRASMGGTWGDYNNDGFSDLFVANQADFTNDLYQNNGDGSFLAIRLGDVVTEKSFSISGSFIDYDNDADLDLFVTNWQNNKNFLYENSGFPNYTFTKLSAGNITSDEENSMGAAWADYDNDGDLDLFIANRDNQNNSFYKNNNLNNNWIQIYCQGVQSNRSAIGTKVRVKTAMDGNEISQLREINAQHSYNSQNDKRVHFGLKHAEKVDSLIIEWPSGLIQKFSNIDINKFYEIEEGNSLEELVTSIEKEKTIYPNDFVVKQNYPNPFNPSTSIEVEIPTEKIDLKIPLTIEIFNIMGQKVATIFKGTKLAGKHQFQFNGNSISAGVYFYKVSSGDNVIAKKMHFLK